MALSMKNSTFLFSLFLVFFLFVDTSFALNAMPLKIFPPNNDQEIILTTEALKNICKQTQNPSFCLRYLKNRTHIGTTKIYQLAQSSIELAKKYANDLHGEVSLSIKTENDTEVQHLYMICLENYKFAVDALYNAGTHLESGNYPALQVQASLAFEEAESVGNQLKVAPKRASSLRQKTKNLEYQCDIIRALISYICSQTKLCY